jgi:hypothetical protein
MGETQIVNNWHIPPSNGGAGGDCGGLASGDDVGIIVRRILTTIPRNWSVLSFDDTEYTIS